MAPRPYSPVPPSLAGAGRRTPPLLLVLATACILFLSVAAACAVGAYPIAFPDLLAILASGPPASPQETAANVVWNMRLSRVALSFLVGTGLALAGVAFQGILRNPLADPFTLGVSGGAACGAALAIALGFAAPYYPVAALLGAAIALFCVLTLATTAGALRRETLVLAGVVVSAFLAACITLVKALNEDSVSGIVFWILGSFQNRTWDDVRLLLPVFIPGCIPLIIFTRELDILALGDTDATHLGVNTQAVRFWVLLGASAITAACVAVSGIIGFVGLVVPHLMRLLLGSAHRRLFPAAALCGGILLLWSDICARVLLPDGVELPVGVITALLGGPFFCFLLRRAAASGVLP